METKITDLKCPSCGGLLYFDTEQGSLSCRSCSQEFEIRKFIELSREKKKTEVVSWDKLKGPEIDTQSLHMYTCSSCGAQMITEAMEATAECPYCGSRFVLDDRFNDMSFPEGVIPFKQTKEYAKLTMRRYVAEKAGIPEKDFNPKWLDNMQMVYLPCWLFDCNITGIGVFTATESTLGYEQRNGSVRYDKETTLTRISKFTVKGMPARASTRLKEDTLMTLYPFNFDEMEAFNPMILAGSRVSMYDIRPEDEKEKIEKDVERQTSRVMMGTVVGAPGRVDPIVMFPQIDAAQYGYCLLPVWICRFTYEGAVYKFCMNGQTGEAVMELPLAVQNKEKNNKLFGTVIIALLAALVIGVIAVNFRSLETMYLSVVIGAAAAIFSVTRKDKYTGTSRMLSAANNNVNDIQMRVLAPTEESIGTEGKVSDVKLEVSRDEPFGTRTYARVSDDNGHPVMRPVRFEEARKRR